MLIKEIFRSLQGEGPDTGTPAVFVRLAGCNLSCPWCDTDHTTGVYCMSEDEILSRIQALATPNDLVVITGGEPFAQPLSELVELCLADGYNVQIETNGTIWQLGMSLLLDFSRVSVICSPKRGHPITSYLLPKITAFKFIFACGDSNPVEEFVFSLGDASYIWPGLVFIQPRDDKNEEKNKANLQAAIDLCMQEGWRLSIQLHKLIGVQ